MPRFFINRPIFAWVIAIMVMLAGILSIETLPVSQYPPIAPPQITINALYPGASAQTVQDTVTQVVEQKLNGIDNLIYMDRVVSKRDEKLSSYGNEILILQQILKMIDEGRDILLIVDELLSTTSPKYQAALTYAIIVYILKKGNYVVMSTHNHEVIEKLCEKHAGLIQAYHNKSHFGDDGKIVFDYQVFP